MNYEYFTGCKYAEEGKKRYRDLVKQYHTDNGATDDSIIKEINAEFTEWWKVYKSRHKSAETGEEYTKETTETAADFIEILSKLAGLDGVDLEICGTWLWIRGNTYPVKDILKEAGCRFAKSKKCWFWTAEEFKKNRHTAQSMNLIRLKYGSEKVENERRFMIG